MKQIKENIKEIIDNVGNNRVNAFFNFKDSEQNSYTDIASIKIPKKYWQNFGADLFLSYSIEFEERENSVIEKRDLISIRALENPELIDKFEGMLDFKSGMRASRIKMVSDLSMQYDGLNNKVIRKTFQKFSTFENDLFTLFSSGRKKADKKEFLRLFLSYLGFLIRESNKIKNKEISDFDPKDLDSITFLDYLSGTLIYFLNHFINKHPFQDPEKDKFFFNTGEAEYNKVFNSCNNFKAILKRLFKITSCMFLFANTKIQSKKGSSNLFIVSHLLDENGNELSSFHFDLSYLLVFEDYNEEKRLSKAINKINYLEKIYERANTDKKEFYKFIAIIKAYLGHEENIQKRKSLKNKKLLRMLLSSLKDLINEEGALDTEDGQLAKEIRKSLLTQLSAEGEEFYFVHDKITKIRV